MVYFMKFKKTKKKQLLILLFLNVFFNLCLQTLFWENSKKKLVIICDLIQVSYFFN